jgi:hypothetical protein
MKTDTKRDAAGSDAPRHRPERKKKHDMEDEQRQNGMMIKRSE